MAQGVVRGQAKKKPRGSCQLAYDKQNRLVCGEWLDSKLVRFVSTLNNATIGNVRRQLGSEKTTITCPEVLKKYQEDMGSIDRNDQMRMHGGGFLAKGHFRKWYKRVYLAIFDTMLLNTLFAWNASTLEVTHRKRLLRHEMMSVIAQYMMNFRDLTIIASPQLMSGRTNVQDVDGENHVPVVVSSNNRCVVCRLEHIMDEKIGGRGMTRCVARCVRCGVLAHPYMPTDSNREIHKLECFQGMSCFQIAHSKEGRDIWKESFQRKRKQFSVNKKNPIVIKLQRLHGFEAAIRDSRKRKKIADEDSSDTSDNNSNYDNGSTNNDS